ncbi:hypothetical protein GCM10022381_27610 [Leifsonia kafniensis]|uniref:DUF916 domain-containing protein n=1 Tax=Leifsonia kafniensis TaxID=475957 RepID=A0ABP7KNQ5_9MICO
MTTIPRVTRRPVRAGQVLLLAALALCGLWSAGSASATPGENGVDSPQSGYGLSVTVTSPTPTPAPPHTSTDPVVGGAGSASGSASAQRTTTTVDAAKTTTPVVATPTSSQVSLGGKLFLDGVESAYRPSVNPFDGTVSIGFTVKNVSNETVDASARFWATGPFGNDLGSVDAVPVTQLAPGESRIVSAELPGVGQWVLINAGYTFTPPATIDGVAVAPISRTAPLFIFPWALTVVALLGVSAVVAVRFLLTRERVGLAPVSV